MKWRRLFRKKKEECAAEVVHANEGPARYVRQHFWNRWLPGGRRERQVAVLQAGYTQLAEIMGVIREQLQQQTAAQQEMARCLLPAVDGLRTMGKSAAQQAEMLKLIDRQLERSLQRDEQLSSQMTAFNSTLQQMDKTHRCSTEAMSILRQQAHRSEEEMRTVMARSERRMTLLALAALSVLAMLGCGWLYAVYFRSPDSAGHPAAAAVHLSGPSSEAGATEPIRPHAGKQPVNEGPDHGFRFFKPAIK
jgi:hypothetical protein